MVAALDAEYDLAASRTGLSTIVLSPVLAISSGAIEAPNNSTAEEPKPIPLIGPTVRPDLPLHDAYSFFIGWGAILAVYAAVKYAPKVLQAVAGFFHRPRILRTIRRHFAALYLYPIALFLGAAVLPLLVGTLFSVYLLIPLKTPRDATQLTFPLTDWALGVVYLKILYNLALLQPDAPDLGGPWVLRNPRPREVEWVRLALKKVLVPMTGGAIALLVGPWLLAEGIGALLIPRYPESFGVASGWDAVVVSALAARYAYPLVLLSVVIWEIVERIGGAVVGWLEYERDQRYLVGRRLHNFDTASGRTAGVAGSVEGVNEVVAEEAGPVAG